MKTTLAVWIVVLASLTPRAGAETYKTDAGINYRPTLAKTDVYAAEMCALDFYYPTEAKDFATVVWFHGGGLAGGNKELPEALKRQGIAVIGVQYRLSPKVKAPAYIEDAAAAVAWALTHVADHGGDPTKVFVAGHSAGAYLANMISLDKRWLAAEKVDANRLAGVISFSGHTITHYTVRQERGIPDTQAVVDELAPLFHARADAPPMLLVTGDREKELLGRYEEVAYFARMMKLAGHKQTQLYELQGFDHGGMAEPAMPLLLKFVRDHARPQPTTKA